MLRIENLIEIRRRLQESYQGRTVLSPTEISVDSAEADFMGRVHSVIEEHLSDSNFNVDWLASEVGLSTRQLQRRVRSASDLSAAGVIRMLRLGRAAQLIEGGAGTISEIAYAVGYNDPGHLSQLFRQTFGMPPSEYRAGGDGPEVGNTERPSK